MKTSSILKIVILVLGLVLIGVAFAFWGPKDGFTSIDKYIWINVLVAYCSLAAVMFCFRINVDNADSRIFPVLFIVRSLIVFAIFTVIMMILVGTENISVKVGVILQLVLVFIAFLYILISVVISGHVRNVASSEVKLTGDIDNIRAMLNGLNVRASALPEQFDGVKKSITDLNDDFRYLSACKNQRAVQLEQEIIAQIMKLEKLVKDKEDIAGMEDACHEIKLLLKERKAILN